MSREFKVYKAKFGGRCKGCENEVHPGDLTADDGTIMYHYRCAQRAGVIERKKT